MVQIYCGNNARDVDILTGNAVMGTRHACLRKGIGRGLRMPYDKKFAGEYVPIDERQIYCGNNPTLPQGYDSMGNLPQCLQKGVAVGKRQRAEQGRTYHRPLVISIIVFLILSLGLFAYLYTQKPSIVTVSAQVNEIDWRKFMALYIPIVLLCGIVIFLLWKIYGI